MALEGDHADASRSVARRARARRLQRPDGFARGETVVLSFADAEFSGRLRVTNGGASDVTAIYVGSNPSSVLDAPLASGLTIVPAWGFRPATYQVRCEHGLDVPYTGSVVIEPLAIAPFTCQ